MEKEEIKKRKRTATSVEKIILSTELQIRKSSIMA